MQIFTLIPKSRFIPKHLLLLVLMVVLGMGVKGQVNINAYGVPVTQDFNSLDYNGTFGSNLPTGWTFYETPSSDGNYRIGDGSLNNGDTYSFGTSGETDRAFGGIRSNSLTPIIGAHFTNNTGGTIAQLTISYTGEQWRLGGLNRRDSLYFGYSLDAVDLNPANGEWSRVPSLDFAAPITATSGSARSLDGNLVANRTAISATLSNLYIPNGASFWIRWTDVAVIGSDDGLAIDDFSITAILPCDVVVSSFNPITGPVGTVVVLTGTNFTGATSVSFNGINSTFTVNSNTQIVATVPAGATSGPIVVSNSSCSSLPNGSFDVIDENCGTLATSLYISEYVEGSGNNKAIEIANFTGATVNLNNYQLRSYHNGNTGFSTPIFSFGNVNLPNGEVYVVVVNNASAA
ncbi:MAG: lamin tail domain-containing protein, partial [Mariniphaga sp.]|nr:lamin tail domain-containing protein [Mariniphaga sp.]